MICRQPLGQEESSDPDVCRLPLNTPNDQRIGTLCVIDHRHKSLTSVQLQVMQRLADKVVMLLELRHKSIVLLEDFCKLEDRKGLIYSCSYCRRIRDSNGNRQPYEDYMMRQSTLNFSHKICQGCMSKHFPEVSRASG